MPIPREVVDYFKPPSSDHSGDATAQDDVKSPFGAASPYAPVPGPQANPFGATDPYAQVPSSSPSDTTSSTADSRTHIAEDISESSDINGKYTYRGEKKTLLEIVVENNQYELAMLLMWNGAKPVVDVNNPTAEDFERLCQLIRTIKDSMVEPGMQNDTKRSLVDHLTTNFRKPIIDKLTKAGQLMLGDTTIAMEDLQNRNPIGKGHNGTAIQCEYMGKDPKIRNLCKEVEYPDGTKHYWLVMKISNDPLDDESIAEAENATALYKADKTPAYNNAHGAKIQNGNVEIHVVLSQLETCNITFDNNNQPMFHTENASNYTRKLHKRTIDSKKEPNDIAHDKEIISAQILVSTYRSLDSVHQQGFVHLDFMGDNTFVSDASPNDEGIASVRAAAVGDYAFAKATDANGVYHQSVRPKRGNLARLSKERTKAPGDITSTSDMFAYRMFLLETVANMVGKDIMFVIVPPRSMLDAANFVNANGDKAALEQYINHMEAKIPNLPNVSDEQKAQATRMLTAYKEFILAAPEPDADLAARNADKLKLEQAHNQYLINCFQHQVKQYQTHQNPKRLYVAAKRFLATPINLETLTDEQREIYDAIADQMQVMRYESVTNDECVQLISAMPAPSLDTSLENPFTSKTPTASTTTDLMRAMRQAENGAGLAAGDDAATPVPTASAEADELTEQDLAALQDNIDIVDGLIDKEPPAASAEAADTQSTTTLDDDFFDEMLRDIDDLAADVAPAASASTDADSEPAPADTSPPPAAAASTHSETDGPSRTAPQRPPLTVDSPQLKVEKQYPKLINYVNEFSGALTGFMNSLPDLIKYLDPDGNEEWKQLLSDEGKRQLRESCDALQIMHDKLAILLKDPAFVNGNSLQRMKLINEWTNNHHEEYTKAVAIYSSHYKNISLALEHIDNHLTERNPDQGLPVFKKADPNTRQGDITIFSQIITPPQYLPRVKMLADGIKDAYKKQPNIAEQIAAITNFDHSTIQTLAENTTAANNAISTANDSPYRLLSDDIKDQYAQAEIQKIQYQISELRQYREKQTKRGKRIGRGEIAKEKSKACDRIIAILEDKKLSTKEKLEKLEEINRHQGEWAIITEHARSANESEKTKLQEVSEELLRIYTTLVAIEASRKPKAAASTPEPTPPAATTAPEPAPDTPTAASAAAASAAASAAPASEPRADASAARTSTTHDSDASMTNDDFIGLLQDGSVTKAQIIKFISSYQGDNDLSQDAQFNKKLNDAILGFLNKYLNDETVRPEAFDDVFKLADLSILPKSKSKQLVRQAVKKRLESINARQQQGDPCQTELRTLIENETLYNAISSNKKLQNQYSKRHSTSVALMRQSLTAMLLHPLQKLAIEDLADKNNYAVNPISDISDLFNKISGFITNDIIMRSDNIHGLTQAIEYWIQVADHALNQDPVDLNLAYAVNSALQHASIHRLTSTKGGLPEATQNKLTALEEATSPANSNKNPRAIIASKNGKCLPYLGIFQSDFTFAVEGNEHAIKALDDNAKSQISVYQIYLAQTDTFNYIASLAIPQPSTAVVDAMQSVNTEDFDDRAYKRSLEAEPRSNRPNPSNRVTNNNMFATKKINPIKHVTGGSLFTEVMDPIFLLPNEESDQRFAAIARELLGDGIAVANHNLPDLSALDAAIDREIKNHEQSHNKACVAAILANEDVMKRIKRILKSKGRETSDDNIKTIITQQVNDEDINPDLKSSHEVIRKLIRLYKNKYINHLKQEMLKQKVSDNVRGLIDEHQNPILLHHYAHAIYRNEERYLDSPSLLVNEPPMRKAVAMLYLILNDSNFLKKPTDSTPSNTETIRYNNEDKVCALIFNQLDTAQKQKVKAILVENLEPEHLSPEIAKALDLKPSDLKASAVAAESAAAAATDNTTAATDAPTDAAPPPAATAAAAAAAAAEPASAPPSLDGNQAVKQHYQHRAQRIYDQVQTLTTDGPLPAGWARSADDAAMAEQYGFHTYTYTPPPGTDQDLVGTDGTLLVRVYDDNADNVYGLTRTEDFIERVNMIFDATRNQILVGEPYYSLPDDEKNRYIQWLEVERQKAIQYLQDNCALDPARMKDGDKNHYKDQSAKAKAVMQQVLADVAGSLMAIDPSPPAAPSASDYVKLIKQAEKDYIARKGRPTIFHLSHANGKPSFNAQFTHGTSTVPSTVRSRTYRDGLAKLSNHATECSGQIDSSGNVTVSYAVDRHSSYPTISEKDDKKRLSDTIAAVEEKITSSARAMQAEHPGKGGADNPIPVSLSTAILLSPSRIPDAEPDKDTRQLKDMRRAFAAVLARRDANGIIVVNGIHIKLDINYVDVPVNVGKVESPGQRTLRDRVKRKALREATTNVELTSHVNAEGFASLFAQIEAKLTDDGKNKTIFSKLRLQPFIDDPTHNEVKKLQKTINEKNAARVALYKDLDKALAGDPSVNYENIIAKIKKLEKEIGNDYLQIEKFQAGMFERHKENIAAALAQLRVNMDDAGNPQEKTNYMLLHRYLSMKALYYSGDFMRVPHKYELQSLFILSSEQLGHVAEGFCKSGEDRTGWLFVYLEAHDKFLREHGRDPDLYITSDKKEMDRLLKETWERSTSLENTNQNSRARGLQIDSALTLDNPLIAMGKSTAGLAKGIYDGELPQPQATYQASVADEAAVGPATTDTSPPAPAVDEPPEAASADTADTGSSFTLPDDEPSPSAAAQAAAAAPAAAPAAESVAAEPQPTPLRDEIEAIISQCKSPRDDTLKGHLERLRNDPLIAYLDNPDANRNLDRVDATKLRIVIEHINRKRHDPQRPLKYRDSSEPAEQGALARDLNILLHHIAEDIQNKNANSSDYPQVGKVLNPILNMMATNRPDLNLKLDQQLLDALRSNNPQPFASIELTVFDKSKRVQHDITANTEATVNLKKFALDRVKGEDSRNYHANVSALTQSAAMLHLLINPDKIPAGTAPTELTRLFIEATNQLEPEDLRALLNKIDALDLPLSDNYQPLRNYLLKQKDNLEAYDSAHRTSAQLDAISSVLNDFIDDINEMTAALKQQAETNGVSVTTVSLFTRPPLEHVEPVSRATRVNERGNPMM